MKVRNSIIWIAALIPAIFSSCDSFLDITPTGKVIAKTGEEYRALLTYEYKYFPKDRGLATLRSDEMNLSKAYTSDLDYSTYFDLWRWNDDAPSTTTTYFGWRRYYHAIYIANYVIQHRDEITEATADEVRQMVGEAYMMRAYCHFLLANLYAQPYTHCQPAETRGIPLLLEADVNAIPRSSSLQAVYSQVLADITEAQKYLNIETWKAGYNYRFNTVSAEALKARVCLYMGDWAGALDAAKAVVEKHGALEDLTGTSYTLPNNYKSVESIMALEQIMPADYSVIGRPSASLLALYRTGDQRKGKFYKRVTSSVSTLVKGGSEEFNCSFRSAEYYLTAAEAAARQNDRETAISYLAALMVKRYDAANYALVLTEVQGMTAAQLVQEIIDERYRELAFEGHRWFDLRRTAMPSLQKTYSGDTFVLDTLDNRYTLRFPPEAVEANPGIELWP